VLEKRKTDHKMSAKRVLVESMWICINCSRDLLRSNSGLRASFSLQETHQQTKKWVRGEEKKVGERRREKGG
jgi:hypothetical protein